MMGPNDGGIKRGDSAETGDLQADLDDLGAEGQVTGETNALAGGAEHSGKTLIDSLAGSTLAPGAAERAEASTNEDLDLGDLHIEGEGSEGMPSVDDWVPSDED